MNIFRICLVFSVIAYCSVNAACDGRYNIYTNGACIPCESYSGAYYGTDSWGVFGCISRYTCPSGGAWSVTDNKCDCLPATPVWTGSVCKVAAGPPGTPQHPQGKFSIKSTVDSNKCIDAGANTQGTQLQMWDCNGTDDQLFYLSNGQLISAQSGLCVDLDLNVVKNGAKIQVWGCNGTGAQKWVLNNIGSSTQLQFQQNPAFGINDYYGNTGNGSPLKLWQWDNSAPAEWSISACMYGASTGFTSVDIPASGDSISGVINYFVDNVIGDFMGGYQIRLAYYSYQCVNQKGSWPWDGGDVLIYPCTNNIFYPVNEQWNFQSTDKNDGFYFLESNVVDGHVDRGMCAHALGAGYTAAQMWTTFHSNCDANNADYLFALLPIKEDKFLIYHKGSQQCFKYDGSKMRTSSCDANDTNQLVQLCIPGNACITPTKYLC
ncbi:hypothetical protein HK096_007104 [Nowakowskiella sp. JEL0078]|nr:hypothetical protein HK096_007104 [Nowakowskiella sp. JEL0078]